jgi:flavin-dependent dehydrogenase
MIDRLRLVDQGGARQTTAAIGKKVRLVDCSELASTLLEHARRGGAELRQGEVVGVEAQERTVALRLGDGSTLLGKVLLAADGYPSLAARRAASDRTIGAAHGVLCCQAHQRLERAQAASARNGELSLFLESADLTSFGLGLAAGGSELLSFVSPCDVSAMQAAFDLAVQRWGNAGLLVGDWAGAGTQPEIRSLPRGAALDAETHVGKNTLVIGDAGGYVSAVSLEGLYGAIRSAFVGADACADALASSHPQDVLMEFDARWRGELVEYLRPPNSDMRFLLPLVFSNKRMAERVAQAFILGVNI